MERIVHTYTEYTYLHFCANLKVAKYYNNRSISPKPRKGWRRRGLELVFSSSGKNEITRSNKHFVLTAQRRRRREDEEREREIDRQTGVAALKTVVWM